MSAGPSANFKFTITELSEKDIHIDFEVLKPKRIERVPKRRFFPLLILLELWETATPEIQAEYKAMKYFSDMLKERTVDITEKQARSHASNSTQFFDELIKGLEKKYNVIILEKQSISLDHDESLWHRDVWDESLFDDALKAQLAELRNDVAENEEITGEYLSYIPAFKRLPGDENGINDFTSRHRFPLLLTVEDDRFGLGYNDTSKLKLEAQYGGKLAVIGGTVVGKPTAKFNPDPEGFKKRAYKIINHYKYQQTGNTGQMQVSVADNRYLGFVKEKKSWESMAEWYL